MQNTGEKDITLITVNGRTFRKHAIVKPKLSSTSTSVALRYVEDDDNTEETQEGVIKIERDEATSTYTAKINIAPVFYKFLIGKKAATKNKIQQDTGATIVIPKETDKSGTDVVTIKGPSESSVVSAHTRIVIVIEAAKKSLPYTHFVSVPLQGSIDVNRQFTILYDELKKMKSFIRGFDESLLIQPDKLHLTLFMLKLYDDNDKNKAIEIMKKESVKIYDIVQTRTVMVNLKGLEIMNDDPSSADVIYAKLITNDNRFNNTVNHLHRLFYEEGFIPLDEFNKGIKLHATILNTKYRKFDNEDQETNNNNNKEETKEVPRIVVDAVPILSRFGEFDFGAIKLNTIELSDRTTFETTGYWKSLATISLP